MKMKKQLGKDTMTEAQNILLIGGCISLSYSSNIALGESNVTSRIMDLSFESTKVNSIDDMNFDDRRLK